MIKKLFSIIIIFVACIIAKQSLAQTFNWAKQIIGSIATNYITPIKLIVDDSNNVYHVGYFTGTVDFDPSNNTFNLIATTSSNALFIQKLDSNGNFIWAKSISGSLQSFVNPQSLNFNANKTNLIISGIFADTIDFDPGLGITSAISGGVDEGFILNLDISGNFVWVKYLKVSVNNYINGVYSIKDIHNNILIATCFDGTIDANPGAGIQNYTNNTSSSLLIIKLDNNGIYMWSKVMPSSSGFNIADIAVDTFNNIISGGYYSGTFDLNPSSVIDNVTAIGIFDIFISKLDSSGNFIFGKSFGGYGEDNLKEIKIDGNNNIILGGLFKGNSDFNPSTATYTIAAIGINPDIFVSKLTNDGNFLWAKSFAGQQTDDLTDLGIDKSNNIYLVGGFGGTVNFNPSGIAQTLTAAGNYDCFVSKFNSIGNFVYVHKFGGTQDDVVQCIKINHGKLFAAGYFLNTPDFDPTAGVYNLTSTYGNIGNNFVLSWNLGAISNTYIIDTGCSYILNGQLYTTNGTYTQYFYNVLGADSIVTLTLTNSGNNIIVSANSCNSNYTYNGVTYSSAGTYYLNFTNAFGCDSNTQINLTFGNPNSTSTTITSCNLYWDFNTIYTTSTTISQTYTNSTGCDSVVTKNIIINYSNSDTTAVVGCVQYFYNGNVYSTPGFFTNVFTNAVLCDSNVVIDLMLNNPNIIITQSGSTLTSNAIAPATYQWYTCSPFAIILGQTNKSFNATSNGTYAVIVTINGCSDTSICKTVNTIGIADIKKNIVQISPNPVQNMLHIELEKQQNFSYKITTAAGQLLISANSFNEKSINIPVAYLANGVYLITIEKDNEKMNYKFLKQ
jgi:Secretion system C-terminal sorting domain